MTTSDARLDDALAAARARGEVGVSVCAYLDGEVIVDAWGGEADPSTHDAVGPDTLYTVFSVTKAITATALHVQAERGYVEYDAPVARYWPEFAAHGKDRCTVRDALMHRAGIPAMPDGMTPERLIDWDWMTGQFAAMEPVFPPGEVNAYHSMSWGWLVGEVVRRTDPEQRAFGDFVRDEIAAPLGLANDLWIDLPPEHHARVARLLGEPPAAGPEGSLLARASPVAVALGPEVYNRADVRAACLPATGGLMTARGVARVFAMLANGGELDGVRLLTRARVLEAARPRPDSDGVDAVQGRPLAVGLGYWLGLVPQGATELLGGGPHVLWHPGAGSCFGYADLDRNFAVAILHNRMFYERDMATYPFAPITEAVLQVAAQVHAAS